MQTYTLNNGVPIPALGLGVFQSSPEETTAAVASALQQGYRHIDTAAAYGNEREVGAAIAASGLPREEVFVESKVWISDYGYEETLHAWEKSAAKLGVDTIDLFILHQALPTDFQRTLDAYKANGILTQAWSPIGGITFYRDGQHTYMLQDPTIGAIAAAHGKSPAQVMLRWHIEQGRQVIPKSTKAHRIGENIDVFDFSLTEQELAAIDALDTGVRGGPEPAEITLENFGFPIPEA